MQTSPSIPPKVFISYSHDSAEHMTRVRMFTQRLREEGIDAILDQYEPSPPEGWPLWIARWVKNSDYVLIICTETYLKRAERREEPGKGHGVTWEAILTFQELYQAGSRNEKFIPVLLEGSRPSHVPSPLNSSTIYLVFDERGYEELYRRLTNQPRVSKPKLGKLKSLPAWPPELAVQPAQPQPAKLRPKKLQPVKSAQTRKSGERKNILSSFAVVIMAAGKGTRLKSKRAKVLHEVGGQPLLIHAIKTALQLAPANDIYVIAGHQAKEVRASVAHLGVQFVFQAEQRGTGHAIMCARPYVQGYKDFLVLSGDVPLIRMETISQLRNFHLIENAAMTILTAEPPDPFGYGRIIRASQDSDHVKAIVEQKSLSESQLEIRETNSGIYVFATEPLFDHIDRLSTDNAHQEFYLTDMAALLVKAKATVVALKAGDPAEVMGANTRAELASLDAAMRARKCADLMAAGVSIYRPETCVIDNDVEIGPDTILEPFVQILGRTRIGSDCRIRSFSVISDSQIADNVLLRPGCIIDQSTIAAGAQLGPYSHLRPGSEIGEGAHVGNFVETKKTRMGRGAKANHLSYLGDSDIGPGVNVGAGTITCNYDGAHKHMTVIEENAFIGSDSTLVAPVRIGKGAYVAAGSTITEDVPADALALGRSRQTTKEGWARQQRDERAKAKAGK